MLSSLQFRSGVSCAFENKSPPKFNGDSSFSSGTFVVRMDGVVVEMLVKSFGSSLDVIKLLFSSVFVVKVLGEHDKSRLEDILVIVEFCWKRVEEISGVKLLEVRLDADRFDFSRSRDSRFLDDLNLG